MSKKKRIGSLLLGLIFSMTFFQVNNISVFAATTTPTIPNSSNIHGVNWADPRDNYADDDLILSGLSSTDDYATVQTKADAILSGFINNLGANTVRIPINPATVSDSWWSSYTGTIDKALSKNMNVIIAYWEGTAAKDGKIDDVSKFWSMWKTVVDKYGSNANVYFEPMNEPFGYSQTDWENICAQWLSTFPNVPHGRILIGGTGYDDNVTGMGADSRFSDCLLSQHIYGFWNTSQTTEAGWRNDITSRVGSYASRTVITEFGTDMTTGLDFSNTSSSDYRVAFFRALTSYIHDNYMGCSVWPGLRNGDTYSVESINGSGTNISLVNNNPSAVTRIKYAYSAPKAPTVNNATAWDKAVTVDFTSYPDATSYNIKYGTASGSYEKTISNVNGSPYTINGLDNGTKYYIAVSAIVNGNESPDSNEVNVTPVAPSNPYLLYYVNCGDASPKVLESQEEFGTNNSNEDQVYGKDPLTGYNWGYIADDGKTWSQDAQSSVGNNFGALRQYDGTTKGDGLAYKFDAPNGNYTVTLGFYDPWNVSNRLEDIVINGSTVKSAFIPYNSKTTLSYKATVTDGTLTVKVVYNTNAESKPMISWIKVESPKPYTAFSPGALWNDTNGNAIDAHGPGISYDPNTKKYYWYGEYHTGTWPAAGVRVYSSTDLYNWKDEGMALTEVKSMDDFTNDPLISKLYAGRTDIFNIWADIRVGRVVERPKVIYNDKTKKYVMWMHIDGDKDPYNNATDYGKAQAGVAISDSPIGPFVYQASYRMDQCPLNQKDYQPGNPGMARDMNVFKDDDGTAYLIYSSEENATMYISKLTDDYLDVTGWHKDGNVDASGKATRDTSYKGVYGVDYIRVYPGSSREAPAMFKYNGKYYLMTSSCTGWSANQNKYSYADSVLGTWSSMVDPFIRTSTSDPNPLTAFNTQTACVIPVDAANGKFIYVGDVWNGGNFSNDGAKYVWLPLDFGQDGNFTIKWYNSWNLNLMDNSASVKVLNKFNETYLVGSTITLPDHLQVVLNGKTITTPVNWFVNSTAVSGSTTLSNPGEYTIQATLTDLNNKTVIYRVYSIPDKTLYFVNSGGAKTSDYNLMTSYMTDTIANKATADQPYDSTSASAWGYVGSNTAMSGSDSGDIFSTLRYLNAGNSSTSKIGKDLTYKFKVKNGSYIIYTGFNDIWNNSSRKADLYINGVKKNAITFISNVVYSNTVTVTDGTIDITVRNTAAEDPLINWIMIVDSNLKHDPAAGLHLDSGSTLSWNKVIGAASYTLYRSNSIDGKYVPVYSGSNSSYTDSNLGSGLKYYYKVSSTDINSIESALSVAYGVTLDNTAPVTSAEIKGNGENNWYNTDVTVTLNAVDNLSGIGKTEYRIGENGDWITYSSPISIDQEGTNTLQYRSVDKAGNIEATKQQTFDIDKTNPQISGKAIDLPNSYGWYNKDVTVHFDAADQLSGVQSITPDVTVTTEGANQSFTGTATDKAGNSAAYTVSGINIDKTAPMINVENGGTYTLNKPVTWSASDELSGLATPANGVIDTSKVGLRTQTITATDKAGNTKTVTITYNVKYEFSNILAPIDPCGNSIFKVGSTIPVKFSLKDSSGTYVSTAAATITYARFSNNVFGKEVEAVSTSKANTRSEFRYDAASNQYVFNLRTKGLKPGIYRLTIALDDKSTYNVQILLR